MLRRLLLILLLPLVAPGSAAERIHAAGADRFAAGASVLFREAIPGDLIVAGGELDVLAEVGGDAVLAGGRVRVDAPVGEDVYAAAGRLAVDGAVAGNARLAGGSVDIGPRGRVAGGATIAGGRVSVLGPVEGYLRLAARRAYIDAPVRGAVQVVARELELGPNARVEGSLRYVQGGRLIRHPNAQVAGDVERFPFEVGEDREIFEAPDFEAAGIAFLVVWVAGLMLLAAVLVAAFPGAAARLAENARRRFGWSLLAGFLVLVLTPLAIVAIAVTIVGLPLAFLLGLAYFALLLTGFMASGIALGDAAIRRWGAARMGSAGWRALWAAAGVLILALLALVPVAGVVVAFLALLVGMGAVLLLLRPRAPA